MIKKILSEIGRLFPDDAFHEECLSVIHEYEDKMFRDFKKIVSSENVSLSEIYKMLSDTEKARASALNAVFNGRIKIWEGECVAKIKYRDAKKEVSERKVEIHDLYFTPVGNFYIRGFCHLRQDTREFNVANIMFATLRKQECSDPKEFVNLVMQGKNRLYE